jgi:IMP dehydrogenase
MIMFRDGLTFDDVLLVPQYSDIESRSQVDIGIQMGKYHFDHPIIPANMKTITEYDMAKAVIKSGGLAILHRFMDLHIQIDMAKKLLTDCKDYNGHISISIGVKPSVDHEMVSRFYNEGIRIVCIDVAHGDSKLCISMTDWIRNKYSDMLIIAGNVATGDGAKRLWNAGADIIKCNIGAGSLCTTRVETGNGVPQLSALMDIYTAKIEISPYVQRPIYIIADGGCRTAGDVVKSLCFADAVMSGSLFSGCHECPGEKVSIDGLPFKQYAGSSTHKSNHVEGVVALVPYKGMYGVVLTKLIEGLRSGCSYQGAHNLTELKNNPQFIKITNSGLVESHPHIKGKLI